MFGAPDAMGLLGIGGLDGICGGVGNPGGGEIFWTVGDDLVVPGKVRAGLASAASPTEFGFGGVGNPGGRFGAPI